MMTIMMMFTLSTSISMNTILLLNFCIFLLYYESMCCNHDDQGIPRVR